MNVTSPPMLKIGVVVVAYNAASTLADVLDRIPSSMRERIAEVIVSDDSSSDATYLVGLGYKQLCNDLPLTVIRNEQNLGYGGNQKACYRMAMEHNLDIVVLLHGDGQYAPEYLPDMVAPLERGECDAVFGSRMLEPGAARRGGMPLYKYVGNKILTRIENKLLGTELSEFHSGYRAYSIPALSQLDLESASDGFDFDTEIIVMLHDRRMRIREIPIPTYYGDEICYVNGFAYARDVVADVVRYRLTGAVTAGTSSRSMNSSDSPPRHYVLKHPARSSHGRIVSALAHRAPSSVLDLGCADGLLAAALQAQGHEVTGIDIAPSPQAPHRMSRFLIADLDEGLPEQLRDCFDVIVAADILEHLRDPKLLLARLSEVANPNATVLASVPSFSHWYPRLRVVLGKFDYDVSGPFDRGHLRFFTRTTFERVARLAGLRVNQVESIGIPFERITRPTSRTAAFLGTLDGVLARLYPRLFAYQYLFHLTFAPAADVKHVEPASESRTPLPLNCVATPTSVTHN